MESVNNIIRKIQVKAEEEYGKQNDVSRPLLCLDLVAENIKRNEHNGDNSAVNIRQNCVAAASDCRLKRGKMICKEIKNTVIKLVIARESSRGCRAGFEAEIGRHKRNRRKSDSRKRAESKQQSRFNKSAVKHIVDLSVVYLSVLVLVNRLCRQDFLDRII